MGQFAKARDLAKEFIAGNPQSDYVFEMLSVLEQAYARLKDAKNTERIKDQILQQLQTARFSFEVYDEIVHVADLTREWEIIRFSAIQNGDSATLKAALDNENRLAGLKRKLNGLTEFFGGGAAQEQYSELAERRYLDLLKKQMDGLQADFRRIQAHVDSLTKSGGRDSATIKAVNRLAVSRDSLVTQYGTIEREHSAVLTECLGTGQGRQRRDEEMQVKYIDWAFIRYQDAKEDLVAMNKEAMKKKAAKGGVKDTLKGKGSEVARLFSDIDIARAKKNLVEERAGIINHITSMLYSYPRSRYTPAILFRLAELYNEQAGDEFDVKLRDYEKKLAEGVQGIVFPEFNCDTVLKIYERIARDFPHDEMADNAYFYKALALQKIGRLDEANAVLLEMTKTYPESEFFVEANMNIARYYFEHPKIQGGKGYKLAEEAYHKVLYYRDHPQFVSALYSLGWCYYMQDQYDEAIAVFKYLVEEVALDFDVTKINEKTQMSNPLLRDEAIDYIAISFSEEHRMDDAVKFLGLIGNIDYAAMVVNRVAQLREEDMDYAGAIAAYSRLLAEYPQSITAPDASLGIIKMYELQNKREDAFREREAFFKRYARGGEWQSMVWKRDSLLIPRVDSIAIAMGQYIAEENYRRAEIRKDTADYSRAAQCFQRLLTAYPDKPRSASARWNLAIILESKLNRGGDAFGEFIKFSRAKEVDSVQREQAALNAIAVAQKALPPDSAVMEGKMESAALRVVDAVSNYRELFPRGKNLASALLSAGSIYFNRKLFPKAADYYDMIASKVAAPGDEAYFEAMFLLAQCRFGLDDWEGASKAFEVVWRKSPQESRRQEAYKFLLQAEFSRAKKAVTAQSYRDAAGLFLAIENKYPGSEYGDAVLFKSAECFEKIEKWQDACESYLRLQKTYPQSKLAPSALFNAATDYEKANKYQKAAEAYELIASQYPESDKAKDALFNLGLCYEKLGNADKVAEANERYTRLYPGEKDVEAMLLRTAEYYVKANLTSKAVAIYRNFVRQFPMSPKTVDALFMIGKVYKDKNDPENAVMNFTQAEQQHMKFVLSGGQGNAYAAAEAAYGIADLKRRQFAAVRFALPESKMKADQKTKSTLLLDATKAYEHVVKYQSEKMFEAAYWIGQMYEEMADSWKRQERPSLDPIKAAVLEKDISQVAGTIMQKSFVPYKKAIELSSGFDSITTEQRNWVYKTKVGLARNYFSAGVFMADGIAAMQNAPVPPDIRKKPLFHFQYLKQVLETVEPMKLQARTYFLWAYRQLDSLKLIGENSKKCLDECGRINYSLGADYDKLCEQILRDPDIPKDMSAAEREELSFQLEDIVFELQDKALFNYEDAMRVFKKDTVLGREYTGKIQQALARLNPDKYGREFFKRVVIGSGKDWESRSDSVSGWATPACPSDGWKKTTNRKMPTSATFPFGSPAYVWGDSQSIDIYIRKPVFLEGAPRDAAVHYSFEGKFWLYVNGTLTASDTSGNRTPDRRDSISGVAKLFKGGDNTVAAHVISVEPVLRGAALAVSFLVDTTQHFTSRYKQDTTSKTAAPSDTAKKQAAPAAQQHVIAYDHVFKSQKEVLKAIENYSVHLVTSEREIKKERLEIQRLQLQNDDIDAKIRRVKDEIAELRKKAGEGAKAQTPAPKSSAQEPPAKASAAKNPAQEQPVKNDVKGAAGTQGKK
jgi:TolA-binding protein